VNYNFKLDYILIQLENALNIPLYANSLNFKIRMVWILIYL